jgi:tetratricopeptide (TPR) repeat protein
VQKRHAFEKSRLAKPIAWPTGAVTTQGEQLLTRSPATLNAAVDAYRAALEERQRDQMPMDWAITQNRIGITLQMLADIQADAAVLMSTATAYRAALEVFTYERLAEDWIATYINLGQVLRNLGELQGDATLLEKAADTYRAVLNHHARERGPMDWAMTQYNLGNALRSFGELKRDGAFLREAVETYDVVLTIYSQDAMPGTWTMTQDSCAKHCGALETLGISVEQERGAMSVLWPRLTGGKQSKLQSSGVKSKSLYNTKMNTLKRLGVIQVRL